MLFHLPSETECELTTFVGRTQKSGAEDVPAVTFRLKLTSVPNTLLDLFSPTMRLTAYAPVEGQELLPDVEPTTPLLRCKDFRDWAPDTRLEGWKVALSRGIGDDSALQMGSVKLDDFRFVLYEGGTIDVDWRCSTADVDEDGAGMLWGRQKRKVFVRIEAPEIPKPAIDGSVDAFKRDHPEFADGRDATDLFAAGSDTREGGPIDPDDDEGATPDIDGTDDGAREQAEIEAGMAQSVAAAGLKPGRGRRAAH